MIAYFDRVRVNLLGKIRQFFCRHELREAPITDVQLHELDMRVVAMAECSKCRMMVYSCVRTGPVYGEMAESDRRLVANAVMDYFHRVSRGWWRFA